MSAFFPVSGGYLRAVCGAPYIYVGDCSVSVGHLDGFPSVIFRVALVFIEFLKRLCIGQIKITDNRSSALADNPGVMPQVNQGKFRCTGTLTEILACTHEMMIGLSNTKCTIYEDPSRLSGGIHYQCYSDGVWR